MKNESTLKRLMRELGADAPPHANTKKPSKKELPFEVEAAIDLNAERVSVRVIDDPIRETTPEQRAAANAWWRSLEPKTSDATEALARAAPLAGFLPVIGRMQTGHVDSSNRWDTPEADILKDLRSFEVRKSDAVRIGFIDRKGQTKTEIQSADAFLALARKTGTVTRRGDK